jgi:putative heme-binding domain-containing protein
VRCHRFGGLGGRLGPNLSRVAKEKSVAELKKDITQPEENLREGYRTPEAPTTDGSLVSGVIKNNVD